MEIVRELVSIINRNKIKNIRVLGKNLPESSSKVDEFYNLIAEGQLKDDAAAAQHFFEGKASDINYRKLKSNLKGHLINTVFFIDAKQSSYGDIESAYITCWKEWAAAKILFSRGATKAAIDISKRVLKHAQHFEFTELVVNITKVLRVFYGTRSGDPKKFQVYNQKFKYYEELWRIENRAEELYTSLISHFTYTKAGKPQIIQQAEAGFKELRPYLRKYNSYRLHRFAQFMRLIGTMSRYDYRQSILICDEALKVLEAKPFLSRSSISSFLYQKLVCLTQLKEFAEGKKVAERGLRLEEPGSYNWFKNRELSMLLALHSRHYQEAYFIFRQVYAQRSFKKLDQLSLEHWLIYQAFIQYLIEINRIAVPRGDKGFRKFRIGRFLNELPVYSKDKRGMNIPILIIQILFTIHLQRYNDALDRIEAIEKYCSRYLRKGDTFRSNCFIKMLLQIPISGFHKRGTQRRAKKYLDRLRSVPLEIADQGHEIEIIPYEDLWEIVLESLDLRFRYSGE